MVYAEEADEGNPNDWVGISVERFMAWVFQHDDIRDLAIIPRMKGDKFTP